MTLVESEKHAISKEALEHSIRAAGEQVHKCESEVGAAQTRLAHAERELRLLVELAQLRGWERDELAKIVTERFAGGVGNGAPNETRRRTPSPTRTALLAAVVEILANRGEPMHIGELMAAVQERGVAIPGSGQQANLIAHISRDERIVRPRRGFYGLREWGLDDAKRAAPSKRRRARRRPGAKA